MSSRCAGKGQHGANGQSAQDAPASLSWAEGCWGRAGSWQDPCSAVKTKPSLTPLLPYCTEWKTTTQSPGDPLQALCREGLRWSADDPGLCRLPLGICWVTLGSPPPLWPSIFQIVNPKMQCPS